VPKDLPDLRIEPRGGYFDLWLGAEPICAWTTREAAEKALKEWRARRAKGEPDSRIRKTFEFEGPNITVDGRDLGDVLAEQKAQIERLTAIKTPAEHGRKGGDKTQENQPEPSWHDYVKAEIVKRKLIAARPTDIYKSFKHWTFVWTFAGQKRRERPSRATFFEFLKRLRVEGFFLQK
jgi:hypothetical protein